MTSVFCPTCETERDCDRSNRLETLDIRGVPITISAIYHSCTVCGNEFEGDRDVDPLEVAYGKYRELRGLLKPSEIKQSYAGWGLSRELFAALLGMSPNTLYRYEKGGLQDAAHDNLIRACTSVAGMVRLVNDKSNMLKDVQLRKVQKAAKTKFIADVTMSDSEYFSRQEDDVNVGESHTQTYHAIEMIG
tara:strand:- start:1896 stop:2465 length:570 start_codon:yes stop_codon:yes gene_type:complete